MTVVKVYMFCIVTVVKVYIFFIVTVVLIRVLNLYCGIGKIVHVLYCDSVTCTCFVL